MRVHEDASIFRAGAAAAAGVALAYVATVVTAVMMPAELQGRPDISPDRFWEILSAHPAAHLLFHWSWIVAGICGMGAVPAISRLVWRAGAGPLVWSGAVAFVGFAVMARSHLMEQAWDRRVIEAYPSSDAAYRHAVHVVAGLALDVPDGVLTYGAIGVWIAIVSMLGARAGLLPPVLRWIGIAAAAAHVAGMIGYSLRIHPLIVFGVGAAGLVLAPLWYAAMARVLLRAAQR